MRNIYIWEDRRMMPPPLLLLLLCCCRNVKSADQKDEHGSRQDLFSSKRWICRQRYFALQYVVDVVVLYIYLTVDIEGHANKHTQFICAWIELSNASLWAVKSIPRSAWPWVWTKCCFFFWKCSELFGDLYATNWDETEYTNQWK